MQLAIEPPKTSKIAHTGGIQFTARRSDRPSSSLLRPRSATLRARIVGAEAVAIEMEARVRLGFDYSRRHGIIYSRRSDTFSRRTAFITIRHGGTTTYRSKIPPP